MYAVFLSITLAFALGFGIWAAMPGFGSSEYAEAQAKAIAQVIYEQHTRAVAWVEEEDVDGIRIHAEATGAITVDNKIGGVSYNLDNFGTFQTIRVAGAQNADWATITFIPPTQQADLKSSSAYPLEPDSVLRNLIDKSGSNRYMIGVLKGGKIEPLDRSANLAAPSNTPWSPMDDRDPSTIPGVPGVDKPVAKVQWTQLPLPQLPVVPAGVADGSWVIVTMTPSAS
jgi:hypothetical protein